MQTMLTDEQQISMISMISFMPLDVERGLWYTGGGGRRGEVSLRPGFRRSVDNVVVDA